MKEDAKPSKDNEDAFYNSQKFEVLYCGKVTVTHKKAPSSLIDDCIEKFSLHERQRLRVQGEPRVADAGEDPAVSEAQTPTSPADVLSEEGDGVNDTHPVFPAAPSQPGPSSSRVCFPERILEDCGFDEQQEFRSRCSSVTGVLQRKVQENSQKTQPRRRHASAPSHVQPSDSEKNRTMLFQVLPWPRALGVFPHSLLDGSSRAASSSLVLTLQASNLSVISLGKQIRQVEKANKGKL